MDGDNGQAIELDDELLGDALALGAATLHEAAGKIGALPSRLIPLAADISVVGRALPVFTPPGDNLWLHHAIYAAAPGDVLVVAAGQAREHGYFGEVMACAARERGVAGLVIDGGIRDVERLRAMRFPAFADRHCIRGTSKDPHLCGSLGEPVLIGDVRVGRGDLVVGDADGVVVLPAADAARAVAAGRRREDEERRYLARLAAGERTLDIYALPGLPSSRQAPLGGRSVHVEGLQHGSQPIPAAARRHGVLASGGISGIDPSTGQVPADPAEQVRLVFGNLRRIVAAGGSDLRDIVKITFLVADRSLRDAINAEWVRLFPDPADRPARHTLVQALPSPLALQCEVFAVAECG